MPVLSTSRLSHFHTRLLRLKPYFQGATVTFIAVFFATVLVSLTEPAIPALLQPLLDKGFTNKDLSLWKVPIFIIAIFALRGFSGFLAQYFLAVLSNNVMHKLRGELFSKLQRIKMHEFSSTNASALSNTIVHEVQNGMTQLVSSLLGLVKDSLTLLALIAYLLYLNWQLTFIIFTIIPGLFIIIKFFSNRLGKIAKKVQKTTDELAYTIEENVLAQRMVRLHNAQQLQLIRFDSLSAALRQLSIKSVVGGAAITPLTQILAAIALSAVICIALWQNSNQTTVGSFVAFITAMLMLIAPIKHLSEVTAPLIKGLAAIERGLDFLEQTQDETSGRYHSPYDNQPSIQMDNVTLQYPENQHWALKDISFHIHPGQKIAFVGASGSGKTSLLNLLPRFIEQTSGQIRLGGKAIELWDLTSLRAQFAYVSQEVVMFNDTLAGNVALGDPNPDVTRIREALEAAHLSAFVQSLPLGIHTPLGHNAAQLSGGQRQRLAIARAIYKDAPILLLDEATSALDAESERAVQLALTKLMENRTTLVVAHRLSTIISADCIMVMSHGKIVETGTHSQLINKPFGYYSKLNQLGDAAEFPQP